MRKREIGRRRRAVVVGIAGIASLTRAAGAAVKYTWTGATDTTWGTAGNWTGGSGNPYPQAHDAYAQFTGALTGSQSVSINVANANAYFTLFGGTANYTISSSNGTNALGLETFSNTSNDSVNGVNYGVGVTAIQVQGSGTDTISAPITINSGSTGTLGFTIDQQNTTNFFTISGNINGNAGTGGALPMIVMGAGNTLLSGNISNVTSLTKSGTGTLTLSGSNSFNGGLSITKGQVNFNLDNQLGAAAGGVSLSGGGIISDTATSGSISETRVFTFGSGGGTINVAGAAGTKLQFFNAANQITGSGTVTKTGTGWVSISNSQNNSGGWAISGGVVEVNSAGSLGTGTVTVNNGGELATANLTSTANAITLNGGTIGGDNAAGTYSGGITVSGNSNVRLGNFWSNAAQNLTFSGNLSGSANLTLINGSGASAPSGQTLTLSGNNSSYTGAILMGASTTGTAYSINLGTATPTTSALPVVGISFGGTITQAVLLPSVTAAAGSSGVLAVGGGTLGSNTNFNLSTFANGNWYLGALPSAASIFGSITPGVDSNNNPLYRLGGGGGALFIGTNALTNPTGKVASVVIGDPRTNGGGTVTFGAAMTYTGSTTIANGTLLLSFADNQVPSQSQVMFGTSSSNGTLDLGGHNTTIGGLSVTAGATAANQIVGSSSTASNSVLTVDTTSGSSSFAGTIRNTIGIGNKTVGLVVQGSNMLTLSGTNTFSGGTTINAGTLALGNGAAAGTGSIAVGNSGSGFATVNAVLVANADGITVSNTITTNKADTGTAQGTGTRSIGGTNTSGTVTYSGNIALNGGAVLVAASGGNVAFNGTIANGTDTGNVSHDVTINGNGGSITLNAVNTYGGNTTVNSGALTISSGASIASPNITVAASATLNIGGSIAAGTNLTTAGSVNVTSPSVSLSSLNGSVGGNISINSTGGNISITNGGNYAGSITESSGAGGSVTITGGNLTLSGAGTYTGSTSISGGNVIISSTGSIASPNINIGTSGTLLANNPAGTTAAGGNININSGGTLGGSGSAAGSISLNSGGNITAGDTSTSSALTTGNETWNDGGTYVWNVTDATGAAGTGWDVLNFSGLNIQLGSGANFTIKIVGDSVQNFMHNLPYHFAIATGPAGSISMNGGNATAFDASKFTLDTSGFTNNGTVPGDFFTISESNDGSELDINYAPEPGTMSMLAIGSVALLSRRRRRGQ
jgi:autotransporter-associated beta strand protein